TGVARALHKRRAMSFRLHLTGGPERALLRAEGRLRGPETADVVREQGAIARRMSGYVVLGLAGAGSRDAVVLGASQGALGEGVALQGGGPYFAALLRR